MTDEKKAEITKEYLNNTFKQTEENQLAIMIGSKCFYEGLEKGLAEGKPKWHDLRKDKTDRPTKDCDVALKVYNYRNHEILSDIGFYKIKEDMFYHYKSACKILAWCETPKFEEELNNGLNGNKG